MALSGIRLIRQVLSDNLPKGWSVAQAQMDYDHKDNVEFQVLTFHVIDPSGKEHVLKSDTVSARDDVNELTVQTAKKFKERLKDEPPTN